VPIEDLLNPMVISYIDRMYDATTAALQLAIGRAKTGMYFTSCLEHLIPWNGIGTVQALTAKSFWKMVLRRSLQNYRGVRVRGLWSSMRK